MEPTPHMWAEALTVIGVNIALFGGMTTLVIWAINKMDADVKSLSGEMKSLGNRLDSHAQRIDQLYRMFVDLLKESKK
jgi:hypothetical protein